jgi:hypothetical protein
MVKPSAEGTYRLWTADLVDAEKPWRHDPKKLAQSLLEIYASHQRQSPNQG